MGAVKIPISGVPERLAKRLQALVAATSAKVSAPASRAIDRSAVCRLAVEDLIDRYEKEPQALALRLGLSIDEH